MPARHWSGCEGEGHSCNFGWWEFKLEQLFGGQFKSKPPPQKNPLEMFTLHLDRHLSTAWFQTTSSLHPKNVFL